MGRPGARPLIILENVRLSHAADSNELASAHFSVTTSFLFQYLVTDPQHRAIELLA